MRIGWKERHVRKHMRTEREDILQSRQATGQKTEVLTYLDVRSLIVPEVVLYCFASAKIDAMPVTNMGRSTVIDHRSPFSVRALDNNEKDDAPIPESKSGTTAAMVTMKSWKFFRASDHWTIGLSHNMCRRCE